jgi:hypothetical protein
MERPVAHSDRQTITDCDYLGSEQENPCSLSSPKFLTHPRHKSKGFIFLPSWQVARTAKGTGEQKYIEQRRVLRH